MISGVLTLASRSLRSVMTPRTDISWVDCERSRGTRTAAGYAAQPVPGVS